MAVKRLRCKGYSRNVPQHVWHDKESHMAAADVDLVEMRHTTVASGDRDILELDVHVVLG